jgi:hypothetical protein
MSWVCFGLLLVCGHFMTGAAVAEEVRVRVINVTTGKPVQGLDVGLAFVQGEELRVKPKGLSAPSI